MNDEFQISDAAKNRIILAVAEAFVERDRVCCGLYASDEDASAYAYSILDFLSEFDYSDETGPVYPSPTISR